MRARPVWLLLLGVVACTGDPGNDTADTGPQPGDLDYYINVTDPPVGDLSCYPGGDWLTQDVDTGLQVDESVTEEIKDFEFETPVKEATVDVWLSDAVSGQPDKSQHADDNGDATLDLPVCTPVAYRTSVPPDLGDHKDTYESHQIFEPGASSPEPAPYESVAVSTYQVIINLLGVTPDPSLGVIAGTVYDCNHEPLQGAQVVVKDADGNIPTEALVKYFVDSFPSRDQPYTSADGLWTAINLPPGTWTIEAYVADGSGGHTEVGATTLTVFADSINISNIYTGYGDGIWYPDSCLVQTSR